MNPALSGLIGFVAQTLIIWLALAIILYAAKPQFWTVDGKLDLWTVFWVSLVLAIFTGIITAIISWFNVSNNGWGMGYGNNNCNPCAPVCDPCPPQCQPAPQPVVMKCEQVPMKKMC